MSLKIGKYISSQLEPSLRNNDTLFTLKGKNSSDDIVVNKAELIDIITRLRESEYTPIKRLSGSLKQDFELLSKYISHTQPTNTYSMLKELIDRYFYDVNPVIPGTIGAYFCGSNLDVNMDLHECSAIGANAVPRDSSNWSSCPQSIILADHSGHGYEFTRLHEGEDKSHTYIYVNRDSYDDFEGFSNDEKKKLKKLGVDFVNLYGYGDDSTQYQDLVGSAIHIDQVKCRQNDHNRDKKSGSGWWLWVIIFFIIIIIILAIAFSYKSD